METVLGFQTEPAFEWDPPTDRFGAMKVLGVDQWGNQVVAVLDGIFDAMPTLTDSLWPERLTTGWQPNERHTQNSNRQERWPTACSADSILRRSAASTSSNSARSASLIASNRRAFTAPNVLCSARLTLPIVDRSTGFAGRAGDRPCNGR